MVFFESIANKMNFLKYRIKSNGGRNINGTVTTPRRKDFNRKIYRFLDFKRSKFSELKALYLRTVYDPNRTAALGMICYPIGVISYILKPMKLNIGEIIKNVGSLEMFYGDAGMLANMASGSLVYNIDGKYIRSAGASAILVRKDFGNALLKLKSGELRYFNENLIASFGVVSNDHHFLRVYKKAGLVRHLGIKPRSRPSAMNPVDHPMGGRTRGGCFPKNKKGLLTLNKPTVFKFKSYRLYTKRQLKLLKE